jgi:diguanylate cyclase (GGDEF)-like protein
MVFQNVDEFYSSCLRSEILQENNPVCFALDENDDLLSTPFEFVAGDLSSLGLGDKKLTFEFFMANANNFLNCRDFLDKSGLIKELKALISGKKKCLSFDFPLSVTKQHRLLSCLVFYSASRHGFGIIVKRLKGLEAQVDAFYRKAQIDFTTGLFCKERCLSAINETKLDGKSFVAFADMNNFKLINDLYGHVLGDALLKKFATAINENKERNFSAYRFGGDEFVIIGRNVTQNAMETLLESSFKDFNTNTPQNISVGFSAGVVQSYSCLSDPLYLIRCSDKAMYLAKKNKVPFYFMSEKEAKQVLLEETGGVL